MSDSLVLLPRECWIDLKNEFKKDFPRGMSGCAVLDIEEVFVKNNINNGCRIYCPYGNLSNGFVRINDKLNYYEVVILCPRDDTSELERALKETNRIDWNKDFEIPFAPKHIKEAFLEVMREKNLMFRFVVSTYTFYLEENAPYFDVKLPSNFTFKLLSIDHAQITNDTWPFRHDSSLFDFELLINSEFGYGLFVNNELVSWCFVKETGELGHLFTLEGHRRRGYGEMVLKLMSDTLRRQGKLVLAFCVMDNDGARKMYEKTGFTMTDVVDWCTVGPT